MSVYERIKAQKKGITWNYLNENIDGAYHGRMTDLKNGKTTLSTEQLKQVSEIIGVSVDYLLGQTDNPRPAEQKEKPPAQGGELSEKDVRLIEWFRSLPPEKQKAILISQDAPKELID